MDGRWFTGVSQCGTAACEGREGVVLMWTVVGLQEYLNVVLQHAKDLKELC